MIRIIIRIWSNYREVNLGNSWGGGNRDYSQGGYGGDNRYNSWGDYRDVNLGKSQGG